MCLVLLSAISRVYTIHIRKNFLILDCSVRVTPWGADQAGADALGDGGLDGHEGAKAGSVS